MSNNKNHFQPQFHHSFLPDWPFSKTSSDSNFWRNRPSRRCQSLDIPQSLGRIAGGGFVWRKRSAAQSPWRLIFTVVASPCHVQSAKVGVTPSEHFIINIQRCLFMPTCAAFATCSRGTWRSGDPQLSWRSFFMKPHGDLSCISILPWCGLVEQL